MSGAIADRLRREAVRQVFRPLLRRALRRLLRADTLYKRVRVRRSLHALASHMSARRRCMAQVRSAERFAAVRMMAMALRSLCRDRRIRIKLADAQMHTAEDHCIVRRLGRTMEALVINRDLKAGLAKAAISASVCWKTICWKKFLWKLRWRTGRRRVTHTKLGLPPDSSRQLRPPQLHPSDTARRGARRSGNGDRVIVRVRVPPFPRVGKIVGVLTMRRAMRAWTELLRGMQVRATATTHWRHKAMRKSLSYWRVRIQSRQHQRNKVRADLTYGAFHVWYSRTQQIIQRSATISTLLSENLLRKRKKRLRTAFLRLVSVALTLSVSRALKSVLAAGWARWVRKSRLSFMSRPNRLQGNRLQVRLAHLSRAWATFQQWLSSRRKIRRKNSLMVGRTAKGPPPSLLATENAFHRWHTYCRRRTTRREQARHCKFVLRRKFLLLGAMQALSLRCFHGRVGRGSLRNALLQQQQQKRSLMKKSLRRLHAQAAGRWAQRQEARLLLIEQERKRLGLGWAALRTLVRRRDTRPATSPQSRC